MQQPTLTDAVREVRVDTAVVGRVATLREARDLARALEEAGLRATGAPGGEAVWAAVDALAAAERRVGALRHGDPVSLREVSGREWVLLVVVCFGVLCGAGLVGVVAGVLAAGLGAIVFLVRWARYRRAWRVAEADATMERDRRRAELLARVAPVVAGPWVVHTAGVRTVCSPDGDWLRAERRALRDRDPAAAALDAALKAEADRIDAAVIAGDLTRLDRGAWEVRLRG